MQVRRCVSGGDDFVTIYGEGQSGSQGKQLADLLDRIESELAAAGLSLDDAVFHRLWLRSREGRDEIAEVRGSRFSGVRRTASSSFIAPGRFSGPGDVALEIIARAPHPGAVRRLVDFDPPRRYAHYMTAGSWLFLSGMAEEGETIEVKFSKSLAQVEVALRRELLSWDAVTEATLFIERGCGTAEWLRDAFRAAVPVEPGRITIEDVDGLASTDKHLEIEIVARRPSA